MIIGIIILSFLFAVVSMLMVLEKITYVDSMVHAYILDIRNGGLTSFFNVVTELGGATFLLATCVILLIVLKNKRNAMFILFNLCLSVLINETFKSMFMRTRPVGINLINETGFSFPSGHSMVSLAFYGFVAFLLLKCVKKRLWKALIIVMLCIVIFMIGFSRLYLGVHYLSDIIAGFLLASIYLTIFINFIKLEKK